MIGRAADALEGLNIDRMRCCRDRTAMKGLRLAVELIPRVSYIGRNKNRGKGIGLLECKVVIGDIKNIRIALIAGKGVTIPVEEIIRADSGPKSSCIICKPKIASEISGAANKIDDSPAAGKDIRCNAIGSDKIDPGI